MRARTIAALAALACIAACSATIGTPRLIGYGCTSSPVSVAGHALPQFAIEESDYRGTCDRIDPLWPTLTGQGARLVAERPDGARVMLGLYRDTRTASAAFDAMNDNGALDAYPVVWIEDN